MGKFVERHSFRKGKVSKRRILFLQKNTLISPNILVWKFCRKHGFRIVLGNSPKTLRKLCLCAEFPHQEIRWNCDTLFSENIRKYLLATIIQPWFCFIARFLLGTCHIYRCQGWNVYRDRRILWPSDDHFKISWRVR